MTRTDPTEIRVPEVTWLKGAFIVAALLHMIYYFATINRPHVYLWEMIAGGLSIFGAIFLSEGTVPFYRKVRRAQGLYVGLIAGLFNFFTAVAVAAAAVGHTVGALSADFAIAAQVVFVGSLGGLALFATAYFIAGGYDTPKPKDEG